jgi:diguanylate cyclase
MTPPALAALLAATLVVGIAIGLTIARFAAAGTTTPQTADRTMAMHDELRRALDRDELVLHYQPKIELSTDRVSCLEALLRWQHPERGLLTPPEFVPQADQRSELLAPLTSWVLRRALADYNSWTAAGHDWTVAVNIAAQDLGSVDFAGAVGQIMRKAGVGRDRLHLEVTEAALARTPGMAEKVVGALAAEGILVSIDDFGTGFTSPGDLGFLKVSEVKIARTLVTALPADRARVRSLIDLGSSLGCLVTAVGVEWQEVADWLMEAGCDHAQGHLWLRARAWTEVAEVFGPGGRRRLR